MSLIMKKVIFLISAMFLCYSISFAQMNEGGEPASFQIEKKIEQAKAKKKILPKSLKQTKELPFYNLGNLSSQFIDGMIKKENEKCPECKSEYYGYNIGVDINILNVASKEILEDGTVLYRYKVKSDSASGLQFIFKEFKIPQGGKLYVYNENHTMVLGSFTSNNNTDGGIYALQPVMGNEITIEYVATSNNVAEVKLTLESIVYVFSNSSLKYISGHYSFQHLACEKFIDVNCPLGQSWIEESKSVGMLLSPKSSGNLAAIGSGALINNSRSDGFPYFLTANHLFGLFPDDLPVTSKNFERVVVLFNYTNPYCGGDGMQAPTTQSISGVSVLARDATGNWMGSENDYTDYMLLFLNERPYKYDVCYSGWSNAEADARQGNLISISHPLGEPKKIAEATNNPPLEPTVADQTGNYGKVISGQVFYQLTVFWQNGITQKGSSGSPLYNHDHKIVGHLKGGLSDCNLNGPDYYGKFSKSYELASMSQWLAPENPSTQTVDTYCPGPILYKVVNFKADKTEVLPNLKINFDNLTVNVKGAATFSWDFGPDAFPSQNSTDRSPAGIYYKTTGYKTVSLTVCDDDGCSTEIKSLEILVSNPSTTMLVDFTSDKQKVFTGDDVTFTSTVSGNVGAVKYEWDFGTDAIVPPPNMEKQANPTVSWKTDGNKTISLIVTDSKGSTIQTKDFYIYVYKNAAKILDVKFTYMKPLIRNRMTVFTNLTAFADDNDPSNRFEWDFGDGTTSTQANPDHTYTQDGFYTVKLKICNRTGCYEKEEDVTVSPYYASTDFVINGQDWLLGDAAIDVGYNTPVEFSYRGQNSPGFGFNWDLDAPGEDLSQLRYGYGPHYTYYEGAGFRSVNLYKYDDITGATGNKYKPNCIAVVPGRGPGNCVTGLGNITVSSQCWNPAAPPIKVTMPMTRANCRFYKRVSGVKYGTNPLNDTIIDFNANTVFPFTDDFTFDLVHFDGVNYTVMDRKVMTLTFYNANSYAGPALTESCPSTSLQLGAAGSPNTIYTWTASPASAISYLSATNIANPQVNPTAEGTFIYTLKVKDMSSNCASSSSARVVTSNLTVDNKLYEIAKSEVITLSLVPHGGSKVYTNYSWSPASYLNNTNTVNPVMSSPNTPGTYVYNMTARDNRNCVGTGTTTVIVSATAPSSLIATANISQIKLDWVDNATTETIYKVLRSSTSATTGFTEIASLPANSITWTDLTAVYGTQYYYRINALEASKNLGFSNTVSSKLQYVSTASVSSSQTSSVYRVVKTADGGYLTGGGGGNGYYVVKFNSCGKLEWERSFGGDKGEGLVDVFETPDGYLLTGTSTSDVSGDKTHSIRGGTFNTSMFSEDWADYWIIKIDKNGNKLWDKAYGGNGKDILSRAIATADGGFLLAGLSNSLGRDVLPISSTYHPSRYEKSTTPKHRYGYTYTDYWVIKITAAGVIQWDKTYSWWQEKFIDELVQSSDGSGYNIIGRTEWTGQYDNYGNYLTYGMRRASRLGQTDIWVLKIDGGGNIVNDKAFGLNILYNHKCRQVLKTTDGNYIMAASVANSPYYISSSSAQPADYWVLMLNSNFDLIWQKRFITDKEEVAVGITKTYDNNYLVYGTSQAAVNGEKTVAPIGNWVIKINSSGGKIWDHNVSEDPYISYIEETSDKNFTVTKRVDNKVTLEYFSASNANSFLKTGVVSPLAYYPGESLIVPFTIKCASNSGNVYTVQLSNDQGSFASPVSIGTLSSTAASGNINCTIPFSTLPGPGYRVRVVSSNPVYTGTDNGAYITILAPAITTNITGSLLYGTGQTVNVSFTRTGIAVSGNRYTAQLSDHNGNFTSPKSLGVYVSTVSSGIITVQIPANQTYGDKYRIRVIASNPAITGRDNGQNITIGNLITNDPSVLTYNQGSAIVIPYTAVANFGQANVFTAQLSDVNGGFANPTNIGTVTSRTSGVINAVIPMDATPGVRYRVRVISSQPSVLGLRNPSDIIISTQTITTSTISPLRYMANDALTVSYTVSGTFAANNLFTAEISDANGYFDAPITIGTVTATGSGSILCVIPGIVNPGNNYRIRVVASSPSRIGTDNGENITIGSLFTGTVSPTIYYTGNTISIPYTTSLLFGTANVFTAQLSNASGSFSNPISIGTLTATGSGTISGQIPLNVMAGSGYRIRVVASDPFVWSYDNGEDITIGAPALTLGTIPNAELCRGNYIDIPYAVTGSFAANNMFIVQISDKNGSFTNFTNVGVTSGTNSGTLKAYIPDALPSGTGYKLRILSTSPASASAASDFVIQTPTISYTGDLSICQGTGNQIALSTIQKPSYTYQWYKDEAMIYGATARNYSATASGVYTVDVRDANAGCTKTSEPVDVVLQQVPTVTISASDQGRVCTGRNELVPVTWNPNVSNAILSPDRRSFVSIAAPVGTNQAYTGGSEEYLNTDGYFEATVGTRSFSFSLDKKLLQAQYVSTWYQQFQINVSPGLGPNRFTIDENNNQRYAYSGNISVGDKVRIVLKTNAVNKRYFVEYYLNNLLLYTSTLTPDLPLRANLNLPIVGMQSPLVSIYRGSEMAFTATTSNIIGDATYSWFVNNVQLSSTTSSLDYFPKTGDIIKVKIDSETPCGRSIESSITIGSKTSVLAASTLSVSPNNMVCGGNPTAVTWTNITGASVSGGNLAKTSTTTGWTAGASSTQTLSEGYFAEYKVTNRTVNFAFGLSKTDPNVNYTSIQHALVLNSSGGLSVYESGSNKLTITTNALAVNDVLQVGIENGAITYYRNGTKVYTSLVKYTTPMLIDVSLNSVLTVNIPIKQKNQLKTFSLSDIDSETQGYVRWFVNGNAIPVAITNGFTYSRYMAAGETIYAEINTTNRCEIAPVKTNTITFYSTPQITAEHNFLCTGQLLTLQATKIDGFPYQWYRNGTAISGATTDQLTINTLGSYSLRFTDQGCGTTSNTLNINAILPPPVVTLPADITTCANTPVNIKATANERTYLTFDGVDDRLISNFYMGHFAAHTMQFWALPTATHEIDVQSRTGTAGTSGQRFVLYPNPASYYHNSDGSPRPEAAGVGISVGTNGVSVYEHGTASHFAPVLVWTGALTTWTHISLSYVDLTPVLYINGVKVKTGVRGINTMPFVSLSNISHPSGPYKGSLYDLRYYSLLTDQQVMDAYNNNHTVVPPNYAWVFPFDEGKGTVVNLANPPSNYTGTIKFDILGGAQWVGANYTWTEGNTALPTVGSTISVTPAATTNYTVTVKGANGCTASDNITVNITQPKKIHVSADATICSGKSTIISAERFPTFNGTADAYSDQFNIEETGVPLSTSVWVKIPATHTADATIYSTGYFYHRATAYVSATDHRLYCDYGNFGDPDFSLDVDFSSYYDKWVHIVFVSGGDLQEYRAIYINGTLATSANAASGNSYPLSSLHIGGMFGYTMMMEGSMHDLSIWKRMLTSAEVTLLSQEQPISNTSIIVNYPMNEGTGLVLNDRSGNLKHAVMNPGLTWANDLSSFTALKWMPGNSTSNSYSVAPAATTLYKVTGKDENNCNVEASVNVTVNSNCPAYNAMNFIVSSGQRLVVPMKPEYKLGNADFTLEAMIKLSPDDKGGALISARSGGFLLTLSNGHGEAGSLIMQMTTGGFPYGNFYNDNPIDVFDGNCHHIAVVRSGTSLSFIVDGQSAGTMIASPSFGLFSFSNNFNIGYDFADGAFDGKIKEIRFWNVARTTGELTANVNTKYTSSVSGLLGDWSAENYDGQYIIDKGSLQNNGLFGSSIVADVYDPTLSVESCDPNARANSVPLNNENLSNKLLSFATLSPNPFEESGTELFIKNTQEEFSEVTITTLNGVVIYHEVLENNKLHKILGDEKQGVYFVNVKNGSENTNYKAIKL